ncbi:MAG: shikimate dehydrogenase, partial [Candidatus Limnocylindria bacterium]|nr:shikimate dehydrogenase [Candidatus Limnocylindria bacterium]
MSVAYLLGHPVAHSLSPAMHNAAFRALGMAHRYEALDVAPEALAAAVGRLRAPDVLGANVTVPHKERIMALLDTVAGEAREIGAVNTVLRADGRLTGHNTDRAGFAAALAERGIALEGKRALVLGAGGA